MICPMMMANSGAYNFDGHPVKIDCAGSDCSWFAMREIDGEPYGACSVALIAVAQFKNIDNSVFVNAKEA